MDYSGIVIDWSCCQAEVSERIRRRIKERTGVESGDTAYGGLPILEIVGEVFIEVSKELTSERGKNNENREQDNEEKKERE